jgi:hypothetical protein
VADELEELFGGGHGSPQPRTRRVLVTLVVGLVLTGLGMVCSAVPGGVLVLISWMFVEKELDRVESGYLPVEHRAPLQRLRAGVFGGLMLVVVLFITQLVLLCTGFYEGLWTLFLSILYSLVGGG